MNEKLKNRAVIRIVDDNAGFNRAQTVFLRATGWKTISYGSAAEFLADSEAQESLGCLILDIRMPGMSGIDLFDRLRAGGNSLPVIFLTGHGDIEMAVSCMQKGAFNFLVKPAQPERLLELVGAAVEQHCRLLQEKEFRMEQRRLWRTLSKSEQELALLLAKGLNNREAADVLNLSKRTVDMYRSRIYEKLDCRSAVEIRTLIDDTALY